MRTGLGKLRNFSSSRANYVMIVAGSINQRDGTCAIYLWAFTIGPVNGSFSIGRRGARWLIRGRVCQPITKLVRTPSGNSWRVHKFRGYQTSQALLNGIIIENRRIQSTWSSICAVVKQKIGKECPGALSAYCQTLQRIVFPLIENQMEFSSLRNGNRCTWYPIRFIMLHNAGIRDYG